jgi:predicted RND superfamily exporter protein
MQKKWAVLVLIAVGVVTAWMGSTLPNTRFDYDFDKFFKPADPATLYFENHRNTFGTDNDFVIVGLVSRNGVFNKGFMDKSDSLTKDLKNLPYVTDVMSPTTITIPIREQLTGAVFKRKLITGNFKQDSIRVFSDPSLVSNVFSRDTSAISIILTTEDKLSKNKCDTLATALDALMSNYDFDGVHLSGRALGQVVYIRKIQGEFALFMGISIVFILILLFAVFRSFRGVLIPMATVLLAVVWSIGILNLSGRGISLLLNMLPPVIFVVGMSDAVHLYSRYLEELRRGLSKAAAIKEMVTDTGLATLLTSITTAIGFASLYFTGVPALQEFGLLTAAGVLAAFVISILLMPAWLALTSAPEKSLKNSENSIWESLLTKAYHPIIARRRWIFGGTILLTLGLSGITSQIGLNNYLLEDLRPSEKLRKDFTFFDTYFSGVRPFELGLKIKNDGNFLTKESIQSIDKIEAYLKENYHVNAITSPATVVRELNRSQHAGRNEFYDLPKTDTSWKKTERELVRLEDARKLKPLLSDDATYARIFGRVGDWGANAFDTLNTEFKAFIKSEGLDKNIDIEITGTGTLIDRTNQNIAVSLAKGLGVAFLLIAFIMGLMFRSVWMVLLALIPNILPLLAVSAVMTLFNIDLKMSTSIIFTIAFGIAVDDTIHLLSRYKLELRKGYPRMLAMKHAYVHTGKALILTSIILFGGFFSLCFSSFQSTFYIGLFVTLTLVFALLFDMTLLPPLVITPEHKSLKSGFHPFADQAKNTEEQTYSKRETQVPGNWQNSS